MRVDFPTPEKVRYVAENMRQSDVAEFMAVSPRGDKKDFINDLVHHYGSHKSCYLFATDEDEPVAVGAMIQGRPNVITLMFFATDKFSQIALALAKFTTRELFPKYKEVGVHRIEAISIEGNEKTHKWIRLIGLKDEGGAMEGFGKNGEAFYQFAWVSDDVRKIST